MNTEANRPARKRVQAIAQGRGQHERVIAPLAFDVAAQISARPLAEFRTDPTQLANGLSELQRAIQSEVICCALADEIELTSADGGDFDVANLVREDTPLATSLEACRRLRVSGGDQLVLLAGLTGPATLASQFACDFAQAAISFPALVKEFCAAGCDLIVVFEPETPLDEGDRHAALKTAGNIARFHRAIALSWARAGALPIPSRIALGTATVASAGITMTDGVIAADADIEQLRTWVADVSR